MDLGTELQKMLQRAKGADAAAMEQLLQRYRPYLRVLCDVRLPNLCQRREDPSDVVQQTLMDATRGLPEFRGSTPGEFEAWMLRLLERNLLQAVRRHTSAKRDVRREQAALSLNGSGDLRWHSLSGDSSSPSQVVFRGEAAILLAEALQKLPERQRTAVELRYLAGQPLERIGEMMSTTKGAAAGLIRRGVEELRKHLPGALAELA